MSFSKRVFSVLALSVIACGGESRHAEAPSQNMPPAEEPSATTTPGVAASTTESATAPGTESSGAMGSGTTPTETTSTPKAEPLSDGEIAMIVQLANQGEVEQGKIAQKRAKNAQVRKFADMMVNEHGKALKDHEKLLTQIGVTPDQSTLATQLSTDAARSTSALNAASANEFDRTYIDTQVDIHAKVLDAIDTQILPNAQNDQLKAEITKMRGVIEGHLQKAREIQQSLASTGTPGAQPSSISGGHHNPSK